MSGEKLKMNVLANRPLPLDGGGLGRGWILRTPSPQPSPARGEGVFVLRINRAKSLSLQEGKSLLIRANGFNNAELH